MNDLEHDLRELFEQRAAGVDVPGLAPKQVLKRGRRRQVGTVVTGVVACLVALGVAAAALGQARHPAVIPGGENGLPERTTSIGGVPVTVPAGWTLVDDYPLASVYATTNETCTFTGTGSAVDASGSPIENTSPAGGTGGEGGGTSTQTCTGSTETFAAGVPIFQMANFDIPLGESVCGHGNYMDQATLPADGVAVYVASFAGSISTQAVEDACPGADNITDGVRLTTFADRSVQTPYAGVIVAGGAASASDITAAQRYLQDLDGTRIDPTEPPSGPGPGYVMAAGTAGGTSWRLEAGLTSIGIEGGGPHVGAVMVTTDDSGTTVRTVDLPTQQRVADDYIDLAGGVVQFGTATADVTGIDVDLSAGGTIPATMFPWPTNSGIPNFPSGDGSIWFAPTPQRGPVHATYPSAPTSSATVDELSPTAPAEPLQTRTDANGDYQVFGNDFGHDWSFTQERDGSLLFSLDGADPTEGYSFATGGGTLIDIDGGTIMLNLEPPSVHTITVTSLGGDAIAMGRYALPADYAASRANIWVTALPGSGTGTYRLSGETLPHTFSWPTNEDPGQGDIFAGGSTPAVSWYEWFVQNGCLRLQVDYSTFSGDTGDSGSTGCPVPWSHAAYPNSVSYVGGVYGQHHATVLVTGPSGMLADVQADGDPTAAGNCGGSISTAMPWSNTGQCVFVIPIGQRWTIQPTRMDGTAFGAPITISAKPGALDVSGIGTETATASGAAASPSP